MSPPTAAHVSHTTVSDDLLRTRVRLPGWLKMVGKPPVIVEGIERAGEAQPARLERLTQGV